MIRVIPGYNSQSQQDASEFLRSVITQIHKELRKGFVYEVDTRVYMDTNMQIAHAAQVHWAIHMSDDQFSRMNEIFYYQMIWSTKCLSCNQTTYSFEINEMLVIKSHPLMKERRLTLLELIQLMLGKRGNN